jgi:hypothetical protein
MGWTKLATGMVSALLLAGCTGSDPLEPDNGRAVLRAQASPAYQGTFLRARVFLNQIVIRPVDPQTNQALDEPIGLLPSPRPIDLRSTTSVTLNDVPLRAGTYRVEQIMLSEAEFNVVDAPASGQLECSGNQILSLRLGAAVPISGFDPELTFTIVQGVSRPLELTVDGPGLVALLESLADCATLSLQFPTGDQLRPLISLN